MERKGGRSLGFHFSLVHFHSEVSKILSPVSTGLEITPGLGVRMCVEQVWAKYSLWAGYGLPTDCIWPTDWIQSAS